MPTSAAHGARTAVYNTANAVAAAPHRKSAMVRGGENGSGTRCGAGLSAAFSAPQCPAAGSLAFGDVTRSPQDQLAIAFAMREQQQRSGRTERPIGFRRDVVPGNRTENKSNVVEKGELLRDVRTDLAGARRRRFAIFAPVEPGRREQ